MVHLDIPSNADEDTNDDCCEARVMASGHGIRMQMVVFSFVFIQQIDDASVMALQK